MEVLPLSALEAVTQGEIDALVATARKHPRNVATVLKRVEETACQSLEIAELCFYMKPRAGGFVDGPSIRLAELFAIYYGNIRWAGRVLDIKHSEVICQGIAIDLETNASVAVEATRSIIGRDGRYTHDMIMTTAQAGISIAMRNALFKVIPLALVNPILDKVKVVAIGDPRKLSARRNQMFERFATKGVTPVQILKLLGVKEREQILLHGLEQMVGIWTAIMDGERPDEIFGKPIAVLRPLWDRKKTTT